MRRSHRLSIVLTLAATVAVLAPRVCAARPIEVAAFPVDAGADASGLRVAAGTDGTMVVLWGAAGTVRTQWYSPAGAALAAAVTLGGGTQGRIAADTRGGYVAAFTRVAAGNAHLLGRLLDGAGQPLGAEFAVDADLPDDVALPAVLGLPSGFAFVWQQRSEAWMRAYDATAVPAGDPFIVGYNSFGFPLAATALADGGFVAVWHDPSVHTFLGRAFDGDGAPRGGPCSSASATSTFGRSPARPAGGFAAVGIVGLTSLRVARFSDQIALIDEVEVEPLPQTDRVAPVIAADGAGNWHVVWAGRRFDGTQLTGYLPPRARPLAADLTPLEPSFDLASDPTAEVATARLQSGSFVNAWSTEATPGSPRGWANVVSLCTPDVARLRRRHPRPALRGVRRRRRQRRRRAGRVPDRPARCPRCGDGTVDTGEACDDGDPSSCDGCDASCQPVSGLACGDGILVAGCADQCDDGNAIAGDGCAPTCTIERVPGGGPAKTDCYAEWVVNNPTNVPLTDRHGHVTANQRCVDDDPRCDFDGGVPGRCTFRIAVCADDTDVAGCTPPAELASWELTKPSVTQAARHPELAAIRAAFAGVATALVGAPARDLCSDVIEVVVPVRGEAAPFRPGKVTLKSAASTAAGARDKDVLKLACLPPG